MNDNAIWNMVDKRTATLNAIRNYPAMLFIRDIEAQKLTSRKEDIEQPVGTVFHEQTLRGTPLSADQKIINQINAVDLIERRLKHSFDFLDWFEPAWKDISEQDRMLLTRFYLGARQKMGVTQELVKELNYSPRTVDGMRASALKKLQVRLFGG